MSFSDEQLNALKRSINHENTMHGYYEAPIQNNVFLALLARLSAAEKVCEEVAAKATGYYWRDSLEAWKRASGKGE